MTKTSLDVTDQICQRENSHNERGRGVHTSRDFFTVKLLTKFTFLKLCALVSKKLTLK